MDDRAVVERQLGRSPRHSVKSSRGAPSASRDRPSRRRTTRTRTAASRRRYYVTCPHLVSGDRTARGCRWRRALEPRGESEDARHSPSRWRAPPTSSVAIRRELAGTGQRSDDGDSLGFGIGGSWLAGPPEVPARARRVSPMARPRLCPRRAHPRRGVRRPGRTLEQLLLRAVPRSTTSLFARCPLTSRRTARVVHAYRDLTEVARDPKLERAPARSARRDHD